MTHVGDGRDDAPGSGVPGVMTYGAPSVGEVLADRYRLEEHVGTDSAGRQVWRGVDIILQRQVAVVVRYPGGDAAEEMLTAAVAVSRIVHPHLVGVYDAIDEGHRAYVVREWVPGVSLRDILAESPLDGERATMVAHAVAEAVATLHSSGIVHGNIHPGTVLVGDDGRVVLSDTRVDPQASPDNDVRAIGGLLYCAMTGYWPHQEAGPSHLPDAIRDQAGRLASPRQVRAGVPRHLDELTAELLDPTLEPPQAANLAGELARLVMQGSDPYEEVVGPMGFDSTEIVERPRRSGSKIALGVGALLLIAVVGVFVAARQFTAAGETDGTGVTSTVTEEPGGGEQPNTASKPLKIEAGQIRVVDPPKGDGTETRNLAAAIDGNPATGWSTDHYTRADFGGLKPGMGILINLGKPTSVDAVTVNVNVPGATLELRSGATDPGTGRANDKVISDTYQPIGQPISQGGTNFAFPAEGTPQYLLVWITNLPSDGAGQFAITVQEITVRGK